MRRVVWLVAVLGLALGAMACREEGTMEKAGRAVDDAVEDAKDAGNDALDAAGQAVEDAHQAGADALDAAGQAGEDAGDAAGEALDEAGEKAKKAGEGQ